MARRRSRRSAAYPPHAPAVTGLGRRHEARLDDRGRLPGRVRPLPRAQRRRGRRYATYAVHVATWLEWCRGVELEVAGATTDDVEGYREALVGAGCEPNTTALKLTFVRRFYDAAIRAGLCQHNPALRVSVPRRRRAAEDFGFLGEGELALLLGGVPRRADVHRRPLVQDLRDRATLALLGAG